MKNFLYLFALLVPLFLTACGSDHFEGRYTDPEGVTNFEFRPDGELHIITDSNEITTEYKYNAGNQSITLVNDEILPNQTLKVTETGNLVSESLTLSRAVDREMLVDSTWIGNQGKYTFALTFTQTDKGLETFSELVTYFEDDMTYIYQTDDSLTVLNGNTLSLDQTLYTVSDVTDNSFKIAIAGNSMVLNKQPKNTAVEFREGYTDDSDS